MPRALLEVAQRRCVSRFVDTDTEGEIHQCTVESCDEAHYAGGRCRRHHRRQWAGIPLEGMRFRGEAHGSRS